MRGAHAGAHNGAAGVLPGQRDTGVFAMSQKLVAYFSATGSTARVAHRLARAIDAELYEIKAAQPYSAADLNWHDNGSRSTLEMADKAARPALADHNAPVAAADIVYLGAPIWWSVPPRIINTFLEAYDFEGKTVACFVTSGGSSASAVVSAVHPSAPGAHFTAARRFSAGAGDKELQQWAKAAEAV